MRDMNRPLQNKDVQVVDEYINVSQFVVIGEVEISSTMLLYYTPTRATKIQNLTTKIYICAN